MNARWWRTSTVAHSAHVHYLLLFSCLLRFRRDMNASIAYTMQSLISRLAIEHARFAAVCTFKVGFCLFCFSWRRRIKINETWLGLRHFPPSFAIFHIRRASGVDELTHSVIKSSSSARLRVWTLIFPFCSQQKRIFIFCHRDWEKFPSDDAHRNVKEAHEIKIFCAS